MKTKKTTIGADRQSGGKPVEAIAGGRPEGWDAERFHQKGDNRQTTT